MNNMTTEDKTKLDGMTPQQLQQQYRLISSLGGFEPLETHYDLMEKQNYIRDRYEDITGDRFTDH